MFSRSTFHRTPRLILVSLLAFVACLAFAGSAVAKPSVHAFEIVPGSFHVSTSTGQAAAHADLTVAFDFAHEGAGGPTDNDGRTTVVELPAGFIGNNTAVPTCSFAQLVGDNAAGSPGNPECTPASQVGTISFEAYLTGSTFEAVTVPLYNMEVTSFGVAVQIGFNVEGTVIQVLDASVRPGDSGITVTSPNIERIGEFRNVTVTTWGLPASHAHDPQRGLECYGSHNPACSGGNESANIPVKPFLSNPTSCEPHIAHMEADSWEAPEKWSHAETEVTPASTECDRVPFDPSVEVRPTTRSAESSSGLDVSLVVPQTWENPSAIATSNLKETTLALPVGYTANPSLASGLGTCTPQQFEAETSSSAPGAGCPPESKIGTVNVETPVLDEDLTGNVFIATPFDNKFDSLLGLYIVVKDPARGIIVKLQGHIEPNEVTGQLVTKFDENPQVPFSKFTLELDQDQTSPLVSPPACGAYTAQAQLTPWSDPLAPQPVSSQPFQIETGIGGGACPAGGTPPFSPGLTGGTENNEAGAYSPLNLRITRNDGEQEITGFASTLPPGLTANLSGIPFCPEADIALARTKTGAQEESEPSCPAASEIGQTIVGAGVGSTLAVTPGRVYMAGPFEGAPFSIAAITSAKVGPFDLGTVVVHLPLLINPQTAAVSIPAGAADQIPHIIKGIVVHVRDIRVNIDRKDFSLNPTNCNPQTLSATVIGGGQDPTNPADNDPSTVNDPFRVTACQALHFNPKFSVSTSGQTSRVDGASLTAKLTVPGAPGTQANISRVKVELPGRLSSRLPTLQKACLAEQFDKNPAGCPSASIIGHAKATTPILPVPLEGPTYFVSHGGEGWPSLIAVLQGYGVTIDLVGTTFISKAGVTSSTFKTVPDQPVTSFELTLPEGPFSALTAIGNLCSTTKTAMVTKKVTVRAHGHRKTFTRKVKQTAPAMLRMPTEFIAQNGAEIHQTTPITVTGCPKAVPAKRTKHVKR
jgi:hypothetical protein